MNNLTPSRLPVAPDSLKTNVINRLNLQQTMKKRTLIRRISISAAAVVVAVVAIIIPVSLATNAVAQSKQIISSAIEKMADVDNYTVSFKLRAEPNENFASINANVDFVNGRFSRSFGTVPYWKIEKQGGRTAIFNGDSVYMWISDQPLGFSFNSSTQYGVLETFSALLEPQMLLESQLLALSGDNAVAAIEKTDSQIFLTVDAEAVGDFKNDYMLNASIRESYNRRTYVFDKASKLLNSFKVEVIIEGKYITVLQSEQISYNQPIDWAVALQRPAIQWRNASEEFSSNVLSKLSAAQAVTEILRALSLSDIAATQNAFYYYDAKQVESKFFGLKILAVGAAFTSGDYAGQFVPCRVKLKNGEIFETNLAIRNDNDNGVWLIDGGVSL